MKNWINKNYKTIIIAAFLVPIITVAVVSISHVTMWYGLSNPFTWAIYLSIGIEIAALSALAAISANMGSKVYFPFSIVTIIQFIGNIFFAYTFIDVNSQTFKDWVDLVSPLVSYMGVEPTDFVGHKRFLAFFAGGMLPVISLSFLHMLVKFTEEDRKNKVVDEPKEEPKVEPKEEPVKMDASDIVSEVSRIRLSEDDIKILEKVLLNPPSPNEALFKAAENYKKKTDDDILKQAEEIKLKRIFEQAEKVKESREEEFGPDNIEEEPTALANSQYRETVSDEVSLESTIVEDIVETNDKEIQREALIKMMELDQELGLYEEPFDNPLIKEDTYDIAKSIEESLVTPALSDEEVRDMFMDEWEKKYDYEEEEFSNIEPTEDEEVQNFSTITENSENIFQHEAPKFNIDDSYSPDTVDVEEEVNNTFWRDHLNEESEEDLKKK
jgi:hypothetical protein